MAATIWPAATASPTASGASSATTPAQGAVTAVSIFMALTTISVSPAFTASPGRGLELDDRAGHAGIRRPACAVGHRQRTGRRRDAPARRGRRPALRPAGRGTAAAPDAGAVGGASARDARRAGWCAHRRRRNSGCARMARSWARLVGRPAMWNSSSARPVRSSAESSEPGELDWPISLANIGSNCGGGARPEVAAGIDPHARPGRLAVGGERAGARARRRAPARR